MGGSKQKRNKPKTIHPNKATVRSKTYKPKLVQQSLFKKKTTFNNFAELAEYSSRCVFVIARLSQDGQQTSVKTLGTGFLSGKNRLMTCSHVINGTRDISEHKDGDIYLIAQRNPPDWYRAFEELTINENLFIYPENDSAVIYLSDKFYSDKDGNQLRDPEHHLDLDLNQVKIGTDVGILGYPMQSLGFTKEGDDIDLSRIILRADRGVVNTCYTTGPNNLSMYEFTMGFNPGNSGGPILNMNSGKVIAIVHAYMSIPINAVEEIVDVQMLDGTRSSAKSISVIRALYSQGTGSQNYVQFQTKHKISFR